MKQMFIPKFGDQSVFELRESPDPQPGPGEVRVRVHASGVNFADIMARLGVYPDAPPLPMVVGYEVAGVVDAVGEGVTEHAVGDRVLALTRFGGYTDLLVAPATQVAAIGDMDFAVAATIPVNYLTAWLMLVHLGNVRSGDRVLVHAVAGGVGQAALQICKWKGATVFGTASGGKHERLRDAGVDHAIDYRTQDFEAEVMRLTDNVGVDIVLDAVGGGSFNKSYRCLQHLGRLYMFGASSIATGNKRSVVAAIKTLLSMPKFKAIPLMQDNRGVMGVNLGHLWHRADLLTSMLREIIDLVHAGAFAPVVDTTFPLEQVGEAHSYIQARKNFGKVILTAN